MTRHQQERFAAACRVVEEAVAAERIPGAALGLLTPDGERRCWATGFAEIVPSRRRLALSMLFDLASLTKVLVTTSWLVELKERGALDYDDPLPEHLPHPASGLWPGLDAITIRQCLAHCSGLPAWAPVYTWDGDADALKARLLAHPWPATEPCYSDVNFMLLGILLEHVTAATLSELAAERNLSVSPGPANAVATEYCSWRGRVSCGEVHDRNAFSLGGIAGHAGAFGTLQTVLDFAASLLARGHGDPAIAEMIRPNGDVFSLGWQHGHRGWSGGDAFSHRTIGHVGFTGTGLWIDFERGTAWSLLTNRVHPSQHLASGIKELRRAVGEILCSPARPDA